MEIPELNEKALEFLNEDFLFDFIGEAEKALSYAYRESLKKKERAVELLEDASAHLERMLEDRTFYRAESKKLFAAIRDSIDPLDTSRDNPPIRLRRASKKTSANIVWRQIIIPVKKGATRRKRPGTTLFWQRASSPIGG